MKEKYIVPEMEILELRCVDIITTSGDVSGDETVLPGDEF